MTPHEAGSYVAEAIFRPAIGEREATLRTLRVLLAGCAADALARGDAPPEPCGGCRPEAEKLVAIAYPDTPEREGLLRGYVVELSELMEDFRSEVEEARGFDALSPLSREA